jgi:branched-subunit amino acid transport protein
MTMWVTLLLACLLAYLAKLAGHIVPPSWLDHPTAARISALLPVSLLAALVAVQTVVSDGRLVLDARAAGLAAAAVALLLRAPFLVVVVVGAVVAAGLRALT